MKLLALLITLCLVATAGAQTIKSLGYNATNGQVVYTGSNDLRFTNAISFDGGPVITGGGISYGSSTNMVINIEERRWIVEGQTIFEWAEEGMTFRVPLDFDNTTNAATTRTNLGLGLPALTNTSNVTMMRALAGSTNTNAPFSGSISVVGTNNTNTLVFSNGILLEAQ
jgi:hypothetical protein